MVSQEQQSVVNDQLFAFGAFLRFSSLDMNCFLLTADS